MFSLINEVKAWFVQGTGLEAKQQLRVVDVEQRAATIASLTLAYYEATGVDVPALNILTKNDLAPLTTSEGEFITQG